jgi:hypothetical protein
MNRQTNYVVVRVSNGFVQCIDNSLIPQPLVKKNKGSILWYEDKVKA